MMIPLTHGRSTLTLVCVVAGVLACPPQPVQASDPAKAKEILDGYGSIVGTAYPPAETMFKALTIMLDVVGYFGNAPDPLARVNERLDALQQRVTAIESNVDLLRGDFLRERNWNRLNRLKDSRTSLSAIAAALKRKPADPALRDLLAGQAWAEVEKYRDLDLWSWSDIVIRDHQWPGPDGTPQTRRAGTMMDPIFKTLPTLEYYATALVVWMIAIELSSNNDAGVVRRDQGARLQTHIAFLSERNGWSPSSGPPQSLPEQLRVRLQGTYEPEKYPRDRICTVNEYLRDDIARQLRLVDTMIYTAGSANELCSVPQGLLSRATSGELDAARAYGIDLMALLAQKLTRLHDRGTVRDALTGVFDPTFMTPNFLYAVSPRGDLLWRRHGVKVVRPPVAGGLKPRPGGPIGGGRGGPLSTGQPVEQYQPSATEPARTVGVGWDFKHLFADSDGVIYAINAENKLMWYRHTAFGQGSGLDTAGAWTPAREVGVGWGGYAHFFAAGDGVIYALDAQGALRWYRHTAHLTGDGLDTPNAWAPRSGIEVQTGWTDVAQVFAGGRGIIYVVTGDGRLLWYRHMRYLDALRTPRTIEAARPPLVKRGLAVEWERSWQGPKEVGRGWAFQHLFSSGDGGIYAVTHDGRLLWFKHLDFEHGGTTWWQAADGRQFQEIDTGWSGVRDAFAILPGEHASRVIVR